MLIGETVSHYRIVDKLGEGGMGVVYRAEDVRLGRLVALKVLSPVLAADAVARRRFADEARAASALDHPNICALYDVGEVSDGRLFLALAFCEGETLRAALDRQPIAPPRALVIAAQIADGLAEAHAKGILHRDIKPANVMVRPDDLVKILDFGVAKLERDTGITGPTDTVGSPAYMAPEQIRSDRVGPGVDLWSLGVVLFEMITGRRPFGGEMHAVLDGILHRPPPALEDLRPGVHPEISRIVARALAKNPDHRYASARDLAADLRAVASGGDEATRIFETPRGAAPPAGLTGSRGSAVHPAPPPAAGSETAPASLAVLPFSDLSAGRDQEWFCEGLAEELVTALSEVPGLRVASRASTLQFRDQDPRATGEKLRVETLLTGSVRRAGDRLRITTQLVRVDDGSVLASSRYDREMVDIFAVQDAIARSVVEVVTARFGVHVTAPRVRRPTENLDAFNLYLKGRHHWNRRNAEGFAAGIRLFEEAIAADPQFALAYAGLADSHAMLGFYLMAPAREVLLRGKELCLRALEIDPELVEARTSLAVFHALFEWDWERAEVELRRVLERSPNHATAHHAYAQYVLSPQGRFVEAMTEQRLALSLDPVSLPLNFGLAHILYQARRYDEAVRQAEATLEIDGDFTLARLALATAAIEAGRTDQATRALDGVEPTTVEHLGTLGVVLARAGRVEEARRTLSELEGLTSERPTAYFAAEVLIHLGETDAAIAALERALEEGSPRLVWIGVRPSLDPLREHPRFRRILERMRLPNLGPASPATPDPRLR